MGREALPRDGGRTKADQGERDPALFRRYRGRRVSRMADVLSRGRDGLVRRDAACRWEDRWPIRHLRPRDERHVRREGGAGVRVDRPRLGDQRPEGPAWQRDVRRGTWLHRGDHARVRARMIDGDANILARSRSQRGPLCRPGDYPLATNLREIEFTQCRMFLAVNRSPTKTWPR